jgi:hypothetical protein
MRAAVVHQPGTTPALEQFPVRRQTTGWLSATRAGRRAGAGAIDHRWPRGSPPDPNPGRERRGSGPSPGCHETQRYAGSALPGSMTQDHRQRRTLPPDRKEPSPGPAPAPGYPGSDHEPAGGTFPARDRKRLLREQPEEEEPGPAKRPPVPDDAQNREPGDPTEPEPGAPAPSFEPSAGDLPGPPAVDRSRASAPVVQARVPEETPARLDAIRGDTRSVWRQRLIGRELARQQATQAAPAAALTDQLRRSCSPKRERLGDAWQPPCEAEG